MSSTLWMLSRSLRVRALCYYGDALFGSLVAPLKTAEGAGHLVDTLTLSG